MRPYFLNLFLILSISCSKEETHNDKVHMSLIHSTNGSLRGMSIDNSEVWFSGSGGKVYRKLQEKLLDVSPVGYEKLDFRSIVHADTNSVLIMNAGSPTVILKSTTKGKEWSKVYEDTASSAFYNAIDFWNIKEGVAFGDPVNGRYAILRTYDGGETWKKIEASLSPKAFEKEAGFAASGTNMSVFGESHLYYLTGGSHSRMLFSADRGENWLSFKLPIIQGNVSEGGYSFDINNKGEMVVVGGDYTKKYRGEKSSCYSQDEGITWSLPSSYPSGYRSCVTYANDSTLIATGTSGTDISYDYGKNWEVIDTINSLNVVKFINDSVGYAAGKNNIVEIKLKSLNIP